jgi:predicted nuclease of predicted toxin-antitoxin system
VKLLLDQGLPRTAAPPLVALGWDVVHVGDLGMATASDKEILGRALVEGRAVVTLDADFHTILALENASGPSVIRIRIEGLRGPELAALIRSVAESCRIDLEGGAMVTVDERGVRVRGLPVVK